MFSLTFSLLLSVSGTCATPGWECIQHQWVVDTKALTELGAEYEAGYGAEYEAGLEEHRDGAVANTIERMPWQAMWRGDEIEFPEKPKWVKHVVRSRERITQIAVRYGVEVEHVKEWNHLTSSRLKKGKKLKIRAKRIPPPKELLRHEIEEGETWGSISALYAVETPDLHAWNYRKEFEPGLELAVWFDPGAFWTVDHEPGPPLPDELGVEDGAISVGRPNRGRIKNAVQLPDLPYYTRRNPGILWGSSHAMRQLVQAMATFRHDTGFKGDVVIGSMSRQRGGRFNPHRSHQSGRDVDIRLPVLPGVTSTHNPHPDEVDWSATWGMISALLATGEVHAIYLETKLQRRLYEAARQLGASHEDLVEWIQWPRSKPGVLAIVRHQKGHDGHIHVRFTCGVQEDRCKTKSR